MRIVTLTTTAILAAAAVSGAPAQAQQLFPVFAPAQQAEPMPIAPAAEQDPVDDAQADPRLRRQIVAYPTREAPGTIVVDTPHTYLYYVLGNGQAVRYGIGVGREGFTWSGVKQIERKAEWPDWFPPAEMIARQPYLPRMTAGGPGNPLGARAMYIAGTQYRIHGTNDPTTIGKTVSSGCIRLTNEDVEDLYERVKIGAKVVVLPQASSPVYAQGPARQDPRPDQREQVSSFAAEPTAQPDARRIWASMGQASFR